MKRDRKIINKMELTRLQRNFEACAMDLRKLEKQRNQWQQYGNQRRVLPYFVYHRIVKKQTEKIEPLMERKLEEIYEVCEKGHSLL